MLEAGTLRVVPDQIVFRDLNPGQTETCSIWIHNIGTKPLRVRFSIPFNSPFTLVSDPIAMIACGLECKCTVKYNCKSKEIEKGDLLVKSQFFDFKIPIITHPPSAQIRLSTQSIDVGQVPAGFPINTTFAIANFGAQSDQFSLHCTENAPKITPKEGTISSGDSIDIDIEYLPRKPGKFQFQIYVNIQCAHEKLDPINIYGDAVDQTFEIRIDGKESREINFGQIYFSQKRAVIATIYNRSPYKRSFIIDTPTESKANSRISNVRTNVGMKNDFVFTVAPNEGIIKPQGSATVSLMFYPPANKKDKEVMYDFTSSVKVVETGQTLDFHMTGTAVPVAYNISDVEFDFGTQKIDTKSDKYLTLTNESDYLPLSFSFKPESQFRFDPESGLVKPKQEKMIKVTFFPRNLGPFEANSHITLNDGLERRKIYLKGFSSSTAPSTDIRQQKFRRKAVWETDDEELNFKLTHPDKFGMTKSDLIRKKEKEEENRNIIIHHAKKRKRIETKKKLTTKFEEEAKKIYDDPEDKRMYITKQLKKALSHQEDPITLGLEYAEWLEEPKPHIPNYMNAGLKVSNPERLNLITKAKSNPQPVDDTKLIPRKFKPAPTTAPETSECNSTLNTIQQMAVASKQKVIDFGEVSVFAKSVKSLTITNTLNQHILVCLDTQNDELSGSGPMSQVIPPKSTAGFDIAFYSEEPSDFRGIISYTINKQHHFTCDICTKVVPVEISMSKEYLKFEFPTEPTQAYVVDEIDVTNTSNAKIDFRWSGFNHVFSIDHEFGAMKPNEQRTFKVKYSPMEEGRNKTVATFTASGSKPMKLRMLGDVGTPNLVSDKRKLSIGETPVGTPKSGIINLTNNGSSNAIYNINPPSITNIKIDEPFGYVKPNESKQITFTFESTETGYLSTNFTINVCGQQSIPLTVLAEAMIPVLEVDNDTIDFGTVFTGGNHEFPLKISNTGCIPAVFEIDLSSMKYFHLECSADLVMKNEREVGNAVFCTQQVTTATHSVMSTFESLTYKVKILPKTTIDLRIVFIPLSIGTFDCTIPFTLVGLPRPINIITAKIRAKAVHSFIQLSDNYADFGVSPVFDPHNPSHRPVFRQITLQNEHSKGISYFFGKMEGIDNEVFAVEPASGTIGYSERADIFFSFRPNRTGPFHASIPLYCHTNDGDNKISTIQLTGVGSSRAYRTSSLHVILPVVPLNVESEAVIDVINEGSIRSTLQTKLSTNERVFPLTIRWPNGKNLEHTTQKLPLKFIFQCDRPLLMSTMVAIIDDLGNSYTFSVTAATDNSIFTLYPFLTNNNYDIHSEPGKPLLLEIDTKLHPLRGDYLTNYITHRNNPQKSRKILDQKAQSSNELCNFMIDFLNTYVLKTKISAFPDDFVSSKGELIREMIENLSGAKKPPGFSNIFRINQKSQTGHSGVDRFKAMLIFLKSVGCILPTVKPEFLLNREKFLAFMKVKHTEELLGIEYYGAPLLSSFNSDMMKEFSSTPTFNQELISKLKQSDLNYDKISKDAWMMIVLQIIKVFMLPTINDDAFSSISGVSEALTHLKATQKEAVFKEINRTHRDLANSNVYTINEGTLLKWLTLHYDHVHPDDLAIITSFDQVTDSRVIASLIQSHIPTLGIDIISNPTSDNDNQHNLNELMNALSKLQTNVKLTPDMLDDGNVIKMALITFNLFKVIPHYIPITTLNFKAKLSRVIAKSFEISNPSNVRITYNSVISGSKNFTAVSESISIGPNQSASFLIEYFARSHMPESSTLTLIPLDSNQKGNGAPIYATPIVVNLQSTVEISEAIQTISIEGPTYEITKTTVDIRNITKVPGVYKLFIRSFKYSDYNGNLVYPKDVSAFQMTEFVSSPEESIVNEDKNDNPFQHFIDDHQPFLMNTVELEFDKPDSVLTVPLEFIPIECGTYKCFILATNQRGCEFVYEADANALLPNPEQRNFTIKCEMKQRGSVNIPLETANTNLCRSLAYGIARTAANHQYMSEAKLKDIVLFKTKEIANILNQCYVPSPFEFQSTQPAYFSADELTLSAKKSTLFTVYFKPTQPGEYPSKCIIVNGSDTRVIMVKGIALLETKTLEITIRTTIGKAVEQNIPIDNPSKHLWGYKLTLTTNGPKIFEVTNAIQVSPVSTAQLPIKVFSNIAGEYTATLTAFNHSKEITTVYKLKAIIEEPTAFTTLQIDCRAKEHFVQKIELPKFIRDGECDVECTVPYTSFPTTIKIENGLPTEPFSFDVCIPFSGVTAGNFKITDRETGVYCWFVLEINVQKPIPEETILVETVSRESVTVNIPITNIKDEPLEFDVEFEENDLFGDKKFVVGPKQSLVYNLVFSPLSSFKRTTIISFISQTVGEFCYELQIDVLPPEVQIIAPAVAPVGKTASVYIPMENPLNKAVSFTFENPLPQVFEIQSKSSYRIPAKEKVQIEVKYYASSVGIKESAIIKLHSPDLGDWFFKVSGVGKPPLPLSPLCIESPVGKSTSAAVVFKNPFMYTARFHSTIISDENEPTAFEFLTKRRIFSLAENKSQQIAVMFTPKKKMKYSGNVIITTVDINPPIVFTYPLVGTTSDAKHSDTTFDLGGKAYETIQKEIQFPLIGEKEQFKFDDYLIGIDFTRETEWMRKYIDIQPTNVCQDKNSECHMLSTIVKFEPQRPLNKVIEVYVINKLRQEWRFWIDMDITQGEPTEEIVFESQLNRPLVRRVSIINEFNEATPFHIYLAHGSASEFTVDPPHGYIAPANGDRTDIPANITFTPRIYGKILKATLVVDTLEKQYLFSLSGKVPDYVPPLFVTEGLIDTSPPSTSRTTKRRNIIRDNIESAKTPRRAPSSARGVSSGRAPTSARIKRK